MMRMMRMTNGYSGSDVRWIAVDGSVLPWWNWDNTPTSSKQNSKEYPKRSRIAMNSCVISSAASTASQASHG